MTGRGMINNDSSLQRFSWLGMFGGGVLNIGLPEMTLEILRSWSFGRTSPGKLSATADLISLPPALGKMH
jgi:hypothetical protein